MEVEKRGGLGGELRVMIDSIAACPGPTPPLHVSPSSFVGPLKKRFHSFSQSTRKARSEVCCVRPPSSTLLPSRVGMKGWRLLVALSLLAETGLSFLYAGPPSLQALGLRDRHCSYTILKATGDNAKEGPSKKPILERKEPGIGTKLAWYASEAFGDVASVFKKKQAQEWPLAPTVAGEGPLDSAEAVERLRREYDRYYFVTGNMDVALYEDDCEFADPFVSFRGTDRFVKNLQNLGPFMEEVNLKLTQFDVTEPGTAKALEMDEGGGMVVSTRWRFRCVLGLPWRPSLAAAGGTVHVFSRESGRIIRHIESWEIDPWDGVKQLCTPGKKRKASGS